MTKLKTLVATPDPEPMPELTYYMYLGETAAVLPTVIQPNGATLYATPGGRFWLNATTSHPYLAVVEPDALTESEDSETER